MKHIVRGIARRGLQPIPPKASISLRVDADVLEWFKAQGAGYQTRMNAVLRLQGSLGLTNSAAEGSGWWF